jgi:predicted dehydrogenase
VQTQQNSDIQPATRREFLQTSAGAALTGRTLLTALGASAGTAAALRTVPHVHAAASDALKVGLIGCGGRGTGAAADCLQADPNIRLTAMGDAFEDRIQTSLAALAKRETTAGKIDVPPERRFVGFDAYQQVIDSGVDIVLLCTPPHFRPLHLKAAIAAGKHVFAEKPVAVDAPGVRSVLETCELARQKNLSVVSGLCLRYDAGFRELVQRVHDGAVGKIRALMANDYRGPIWVKPRQPDWSEMTYQMRNWYYFTWLSGDFNVEQHVHFLDVCAWLKGEYPIKAVGMGGRQVRTGPEYGNIFDHHSVTYEFADGCRLFANTRQMPGCFGNMSARVLGEKGLAEVSERRLEIKLDDSGGTSWRYRGEHKNMFHVEHDELVSSIRNAKPINNGQYMALSTLLAILGRMVTYTGQEITWEKVLNSQETLAPDRYTWDGAPPPATIAVPGVTQLT